MNELTSEKHEVRRRKKKEEVKRSKQLMVLMIRRANGRLAC